MAVLRLILGDQLDPHVAALKDTDKDADLILIAEVMEEASYVRHHKKKIAFLFSAMRHFAAELEHTGHDVRYVTLDAKGNSGSLKGEVARALTCGSFDRLVVTEPGEYRLRADMETWSDALGLPVEIREDDRFICPHEDFRNWARGRQRLTMEYFYREMRRKTGLLMDGDQPVGGQWNYDRENRKPPKKGLSYPRRAACRIDDKTAEVLALVAERFADHPGDLEPFGFAVTREEAMRERDAFMEKALPHFGDYQDAMVAGEPWLYHSVLALYMNCGLLDPRDVCERAEQAWRDGHAPLNAVEGFIRQVLGWREYVRGLYWLKMPDYAESNFLDAQRTLPDFYWTGETDMACLADAIGTTLKHAYAHHIQRLTITGAFALMAGIRPSAVEAWYLLIYADAYEWVELPNTHGMALFADGGLMATKPYAVSGSYINKMSDYCGSCAYNVKDKTGKKACPFNYLYWDFLSRNEERLRDNHRLAMPYRTLEKMDPALVAAMRAEAARFLDAL
ncbi:MULTISPECIES: cryptochrome/photolyase family protein [Hyphobacterium]|uniref:Cryptochrome/photolyase family protein n=1 Tax=Hyphobacterium vulgare TaxID=1736751 RepID=A0ABV6ZT97_9PROT